MNIDKRALKGVVDEIEASRARQKGETEFQREALKRAVKNHQLDAKAIRIVLQRRAMGESKRDEQDYYVHSYEVALGGKKDALEALERGATIREAAKAGGISTGSAAALAKGVQESSFVNSETGEITETAAGDRPREEFNPKATGSSLSSDARQVPTGQPGNTGGDHVASTADIHPIEHKLHKSPAGGEKPVTPAGGHDDKRWLTVEPEVARVAPPALGAVGAMPRVASDKSNEVETVLIDGLGVSGKWREKCAAGPDTTSGVAGSDPAVCDSRLPQPDSHSTGDDGRELPRRLDRRVRA